MKKEVIDYFKKNCKETTLLGKLKKWIFFSIMFNFYPKGMSKIYEFGYFLGIDDGWKKDDSRLRCVPIEDTK